MVYFGVFLFFPILCSSLIFLPKSNISTPISFLCPCTSIFYLRLPSVGGAHMLRNQRGGWDVRLGKKRNNVAQVGTELFWHTIYCANPRPKPVSQSGLLYRKELKR